MTTRAALLVVGETLPAIAAARGSFVDWFRAGTGLPLEVVDAREDLPAPTYGAVVVTGSAAMVTERAPWSVRAGEWLRAQLDRPMLAVCYGHQLLADVLGGEVGTNPNGREIGTIEVHTERDPLFDELPDPLVVQSTHVESVLSLPPVATRIASSALDPNQGYRVGRAWCLQFHPEMDADIIRAYVRARREAITAEGLDPDALLAAARDTSHGRDILRRFAALAIP